MIRNFAEAHAVLHAFYNTPGTNTYTLDRMRALMDYLGNPQDDLKIVHVAGTSGKTSTVYYTAALLNAAGFKVGLTASPHVDEVNERVQIDMVPMPEAEFCRSLSDFVDIVHESKIAPSYFELLVAFAYWEFARQKVDYAVIEVGLGGLLDGTNVVSREDKVCVITDIGLDHTNILGKTLTAIATQKAGIIFPHTHAFMFEQGEDVMKVLTDVCDHQMATLHIEKQNDELVEAYSIPLFQKRNLGLARKVVDYVLERDGQAELTDNQINQAAAIKVPARMEQFRVGEKTLIVDGSHNGQKLGALAESIRAQFPDKRIAALVAFVGGHDERWQLGVDVLIKLTDKMILTSFASEQDVPKRSADPNQIAEYCHDQGFVATTVAEDPKKAFGLLLEQEESVLLVAGSFYLLNHVRPLVK